MEKVWKKITICAVVAAFASISLLAAAPKAVNIETMKLIKTAMSSRAMMQRVAKDYLYIGNDVATSKAERDAGDAQKVQCQAGDIE